jgi:adenosine 3'-phospho 5'-phosphosulfate transporter B3
LFELVVFSAMTLTTMWWVAAENFTTNIENVLLPNKQQQHHHHQQQQQRHGGGDLTTVTTTTTTTQSKNVCVEKGGNSGGSVGRSCFRSGAIGHLKAPIHLYVASASLMGIYTSLGKVSYKYINYATGTVLKSSKLIPVIVLSAVWLKRTYHYLDYLACVLLVVASCFFAMGEHEGNKRLGVEDPTLYAFGFFLSFFCVIVGAVQSNVVDKALRDYDATVNENMLMTNSIGALLVFVVVLAKEPDAFAFFFGDWFYLSLITFRSIVFWLGAMFYTTLVKHFGAVPAVAVTTCRKVLTVISSFVFFASDKPFGATYFVALLFFFGAVACEFLKHKFPMVSKSQQLEMARKDSDAEKISSKNTIEKL